MQLISSHTSTPSSLPSGFLRAILSSIISAHTLNLRLPTSGKCQSPNIQEHLVYAFKNVKKKGLEDISVRYHSFNFPLAPGPRESSCLSSHTSFQKGHAISEAYYPHDSLETTSRSLSAVVSNDINSDR